MSSENKKKIPVKTKKPNKSKTRSLLSIATGIIKNEIKNRFEEKRRKTQEIQKSVKLITGLVVGLLTLSITLLIILGIAALTWLGQNTALPANTNIFVAGALLGYLAAIIAAIIYSKYY